MSSSLAREYFILSEIATNMRSGFILLNPAEQVAYFNSSAERLIGINRGKLLEQPIFDVRKQLISLAANLKAARKNLTVSGFILSRKAALTWHWLMPGYAGCACQASLCEVTLNHR